MAPSSSWRFELKSGRRADGCAVHVTTATSSAEEEAAATGGGPKRHGAITTSSLPKISAPGHRTHPHVATQDVSARFAYPLATRGEVAMRRGFAIAAVLVSALTVACGATRSYETVQQPKGTTLTAGIGGKIFRIERSGDLPNAFGKKDIWGGKVDQGFVELRFAGVADDGRLVLRLTDVETRSNETTMSRYGVGHATVTASTYGNWTTASGVYIPPPQGETVVLPPNTIEFLYDTTKGPLLIEGMEVTFMGSSAQSVTYRLQDLLYRH
jgi:hypothetical protein